MRQRLSDLDMARMEYHVVSGDLREHSSFQYWKAHWPALVQSLGSNERLPDSEFLKQDKATLLTSEQDIVGIHLISRYQSKQFTSHPYFAEYDDVFLRKLMQHGVRDVQALQYFMVDEKYSVARTLVNFGAIIASLSLKHQLNDRLDATVTLARSDIPVTSLGLKLGFEELSSRIMHNVPVSMLACFEPKPYAKPEVTRWVDYYWNRRRTQQVGIEEKAA